MMAAEAEAKAVKALELERANAIKALKADSTAATSSKRMQGEKSIARTASLPASTGSTLRRSSLPKPITAPARTAAPPPTKPAAKH